MLARLLPIIPIIASTAFADFTKVDDFSAYPNNTTINGQGGWTSNESAHRVSTDPTNSGNRVLAIAAHSNNAQYARLPVSPLANGSTGTLFFRFYAPTSGSFNLSMGLSDLVSPTENYGHYEPQLRLKNDLANGILDGRDGAHFKQLTSVSDLAAGQTGTWYKVWLVADNQSDSSRIFIQSDGGSNFSEITELSPPEPPLEFRNGTNSALQSILIISANATGNTYFDDLYFDANRENLNDPTIPVQANNDSITVNIKGALSFDPTENDINATATSVSIISQPAYGTVTFDQSRGLFIYKHTGTNTNSDTFTYQISNGLSSDTATIGVNVSSDFRLEPTTLNVPISPPANESGELSYLDALPGLNFEFCVAVVQVPGNTKAILVASINGKIWYVPDTTASNPQSYEVLDISSLSNFVRGRSIYSITCFPDFATTGNIIVNYQGDSTRLPIPGVGQTIHDVITGLDKNGVPDDTIETDLRISRFTLSAAHIANVMFDGMSTQENAAALATEFPYLNLAEQHLFHSINDCHFGPDGYLYVSFGDEGDQGDPYRNGQTITKDQYCSILRIDVAPNSTNPKPTAHYAIAVGDLDSNGRHGFFTNPTTQEPNFRVPEDNPFIHTSLGGSWNGDFNGTDLSGQLDSVRTEIWALGLRNPFKFHLDQEDGTGETEAWIGDVGKADREEFTILKMGENGGWSYYEGDIQTPGKTHPSMPAGATPHKLPLYTYPHSSVTGRSATGGIFYRRTELSALTGRYICADYNSGNIWSIGRGGDVVKLAFTGNGIVDFELDPHTGDIFVLEIGSSTVKRITAAPDQVDFGYPTRLSETGVFADVHDFSPNPGVIPYEPNLAFWSDNALKQRWMTIPTTSDKIGFSPDNKWAFPTGMIWIKHFDYDLDQTNPGTQLKRLETRILVENGTSSYGVSYRWNESDTEAHLVDAAGDDFIIEYTDSDGNQKSLNWQVPSRSECMTCHTQQAGVGLSMNTRQLNREATIHNSTGNLLTLLSDGGFLDGFTGNPTEYESHSHPKDLTKDLEHRVRSYLDVNCAYCHQSGNSISANWDGRAYLPIEQTGLVYGAPVSEGAPNLTDHIIRPGSLDHSAIWNRVNARTATNGTHNGYSQMPPLATNMLDQEAIDLLSEWILNHVNVSPSPTAGSLTSANVSENAVHAASLGLVATLDPDVRTSGADQNTITYEITAGNHNNQFDINSSTGEISVNGFLNFESNSVHTLTVKVSDNFTPNPGVSYQTVVIQILDETVNDMSEDLDNNGIFDLWEQSFGLSAVDPSSNDDGDSTNVFFEFISGGNPTTAERSIDFKLDSFSDNTDEPLLSWRVRNGFELDGHYGVELSSDLQAPWEQVYRSTDYQVISVIDEGNGISRVTIKVMRNSNALFFRLYQITE